MHYHRRHLRLDNDPTSAQTGESCDDSPPTPPTDATDNGFRSPGSGGISQPRDQQVLKRRCLVVGGIFSIDQKWSVIADACAEAGEDFVDVEPRAGRE